MGIRGVGEGHGKAGNDINTVFEYDILKLHYCLLRHSH